MKKLSLLNLSLMILLLGGCGMNNADNTITTKSGLQYTITKPAPAGAKSPTARKVVTVHYTGWLYVDGKATKKFDSSVDRNQPFMFVVGMGQVIKGWDEAVMGMKVGEKRRVIIPPSLGYGAQVIGNGLIPANSTLVFDIELLEAD